jgi:peptide/nickel transport system substrate-binding protein
MQGMRKLLIPLVILLVAITAISCGESTPATTPTSTSMSTPTATSPATTAQPAPSTTAKPEPTTTVSAPTKKYGGTLRYIIYTAPTAIAGWPADTGLSSSAAYEGMISTQSDGTVTPLLAESWEIAQDRSSITFKLRKGVKFTDGTDFNAEAVKFNYDAQIANKKAAYWSSVEVLDDYTLKVNLTAWRPTTMLQFGDSNTSGIASPTAFKEKGIDWLREHPVGTGAFMFKSFTRDVGQVYVKNPNYWQPGKPYIDVYDTIVITDDMTTRMAMQAGEGDVTMCELGKGTIYYRDQGLDIASAIQAVVCLVPDTANADSPWSNKLVREAAEYSIDKVAIATGLGLGLWEAPYQVPPRGNAVWNADFKLARKYDLDKAKQLMAEAGYPDGFQTTIYPFPGMNRDATLAVTDALSKIGIIADVQFVDFGKYFQMNQEGWNNGVMLHPCPAYAIYVETLNTLFDRDTSFFFKKSWERTPEFIEALKMANSTLEQDVPLTRAVTDLMIKDCMVIPVWEGGMSYAYRDYVKDAGFLSRGFSLYWNVEDVWLDK